MKTKQMKTIGRLIEMKRRAAESAELAHAAAHARSAAADRARSDAERAWLAAVDANDHIGVVFDLEFRDLQIRGLRRALEQAEHQYAVARAAEARARGTMTEARIELRRFETWLEKTTREHDAELRQRERIAEDEVAARSRRAG